MKKVIIMFAAAAMLFGACCNKQEAAPADPAEVVMQNILNRKSVRSYTGDTIPAAVMENLLRAAMSAPTGMDIRPWSFVVLSDKSQYETIFEGNGNMKKFMESGAIIVVCADTTVTRPTREDPDGPAVTRPNPMWRDDVAAATENLLLAVEGYGLGACWTACYPFENTMAPVRKNLGLPDNVVPYAVVPIGYPSTENSPKDKWDPSRVHYDRW
ncbi:MAG: nitroreductase family protein [Bacteroidales bacterium]|nr:nitroreductase family protein [Bacteroidales bacterium]